VGSAEVLIALLLWLGIAAVVVVVVLAIVQRVIRNGVEAGIMRAVENLVELGVLQVPTDRDGTSR
jgi:hypothetical protein